MTRGRRGFTIIEVAVVLFILALILLMYWLYGRKTIANYRFNQSIQSVENAINLTRMRALALQQDTYLWFRDSSAESADDSTYAPPRTVDVKVDEVKFIYDPYNPTVPKKEVKPEEVKFIYNPTALTVGITEGTTDLKDPDKKVQFTSRGYTKAYSTYSITLTPVEASPLPPAVFEVNVIGRVQRKK